MCFHGKLHLAIACVSTFALSSVCWENGGKFVNTSRLYLASQHTAAKGTSWTFPNHSRACIPPIFFFCIWYLKWMNNKQEEWMNYQPTNQKILTENVSIFTNQSLYWTAQGINISLNFVCHRFNISFWRTGPIFNAKLWNNGSILFDTQISMRPV